jgi:hypothetical protein
VPNVPLLGDGAGASVLIYAVDPGTEQSAVVVYDSEACRIVQHVTSPNDIIIASFLMTQAVNAQPFPVMVCEQIESYGMAVGAETFRTVWWAGRFHQAWPGEAFQLPRRAVKLHLCHSARATDANIRQAILDRFGPGKDAAIGKKASPGPLWGVKGHEFAALAVALTWADTQPTAPLAAPAPQS